MNIPENYKTAELAGKAAVFKCVVHSIREKELPELNDEYASDISEFETFAEYKEDVKKKLSDKKREEEEKKREDALLDEVVADSEVELPDAMVDSNIELMLRDYARNLRYQGLSLEQYFQYTGQTLDGMREQMRPDTIKRLKGSLVLEAIAVEEGLKTTDEEFAEEIKKRAEEAHMEADKYEGMLSNGQKREMKENMEIDKAMKFIVAQAKEKKA